MRMNDQIFIEQLCFPARIGVYEQEKQQPQNIVLDIQLTVDIRSAAQTDALEDTLDYARLTHELANHCLKQHVDLVETLAEQLAMICLADKRVSTVTLRLGKPYALTQAKSVGVQITRYQP